MYICPVKFHLIAHYTISLTKELCEPFKLVMSDLTLLVMDGSQAGLGLALKPGSPAFQVVGVIPLSYYASSIACQWVTNFRSAATTTQY